MSRSMLVEQPLAYDPTVLLQMIEMDPYSFSEGQRNDDIVNWFFAKRLLEIRGPGTNGAFAVQKYIEDFDNLRLSADQLRSLREWKDSTPKMKIEQLWAHYASIVDPKRLSDLWIPAYYNEPDFSGGTMPLL
jgi:hypothetical protein